MKTENSKLQLLKQIVQFKVADFLTCSKVEEQFGHISGLIYLTKKGDLPLGTSRVYQIFQVNPFVSWAPCDMIGVPVTVVAL